MKVLLSVDKICKHSIRYAAEDEKAPFDTIYVKKAWLGPNHPEELLVEISKEGVSENAK